MNRNSIISFLFQFFLFLSIALMPIQLGKVWWLSETISRGWRVDFLALWLYASDLVIFIATSLGILYFKDLFLEKCKNKKILFFLLWLFCQSFWSVSPIFQIYWSFKITLYLLWCWGIATFFKNKIEENSKFIKILLAISLSQIFFISVLAWGQFIFQHSLQGVWYFTGERFFNSQTPGIAREFVVNGLFLRPYAMFPHPNVLAGFLTITIFNVLWILKLGNLKNRKLKFVISGFLVLGFSSLVLAFSQAAWLAFVIGIILFFFPQFSRKFAIGSFVFCFMAPLVLLPFSWNQEISQRNELFLPFLWAWKSWSLIGFGWQGQLWHIDSFPSVVASRLMLQPLHNLLWWSFACLGLPVSLFVLAYFKKTLAKFPTDHPLFFFITLFFILGSVDHYLLTLVQGKLILVFTLAFWGSYKK